MTPMDEAVGGGGGLSWASMADRYPGCISCQPSVRG
jgi:hypothetical protein